jgi:hypothetical protein
LEHNQGKTQLQVSAEFNHFRNDSRGLLIFIFASFKGIQKMSATAADLMIEALIDWKVDMASYKAEFLARYFRFRLTGRKPLRLAN